MLRYFQQVNLKGNQKKQKYGKQIYFFLYYHILYGLTLMPQSCQCTLDHIHKFSIRSYWQVRFGAWCFHRFTYNWGLSWCWHWCTLNHIHKFPIRSYWQATFGMWCFHRFTYNWSNWGLSWGLQWCCLD